MFLESSPLIRIWDFAVTPDVVGFAFLVLALLVALLLVVVSGRRLLGRRRG